MFVWVKKTTTLIMVVFGGRNLLESLFPLTKTDLGQNMIYGFAPHFLSLRPTPPSCSAGPLGNTSQGARERLFGKGEEIPKQWGKNPLTSNP